MKTSIVLIALIILNTTALLSESLAQLVNGIDSWLLIGLEILLICIWFINNFLKGLKTISNIDLSGIELFVINPNDKTQGKP